MTRYYRFIPVGRSSIYGFKERKNINNNFKGGTIREIVADYLSDFDIPQPASHVAQHVIQYRPKSNEYSIIQNLKLQTKNSFKFYERNLVGLSLNNISFCIY